MTPSDIAEEWEERAAIMEFDGELARTDAETAAWALMRSKYGDEACALAVDVVNNKERP